MDVGVCVEGGVVVEVAFLHEVFECFGIVTGIEVAECVEEVFGLYAVGLEWKLGEVEDRVHLVDEGCAVEVLHGLEGIVHLFVDLEKGDEGFDL